MSKAAATFTKVARFGIRLRCSIQPYPTPCIPALCANGTVKEGSYADAIIEFIKDWTCEAPGSVKHGAATWFLFESERAFFVACSKAGIDAEKFRSHLAPLTSSSRQ